MRRDPGPHPAVRVVLGLALGAALGALVALVLPRERHMADGHGPAGASASREPAGAGAPGRPAGTGA